MIVMILDISNDDENILIQQTKNKHIDIFFHMWVYLLFLSSIGTLQLSIDVIVGTRACTFTCLEIKPIEKCTFKDGRKHVY